MWGIAEMLVIRKTYPVLEEELGHFLTKNQPHNHFIRVLHTSILSKSFLKNDVVLIVNNKKISPSLLP
jgi:hypothetical protein